MNDVIRNGWHRLKGGAALAVRLPARVDVSGAARFMRRGVADLVFPPSCVSCEAELDAEAAPAQRCAAVRGVSRPDGAVLWADVWAVRCAGAARRSDARRRDEWAVIAAAGGRCGSMKRLRVGRTAGKLRELLLRMKHGGGRCAVAGDGASSIWQERGERLAEIEADVVVPIPLHWRRRLAHRTNSAAVLAEVLAARLRCAAGRGLAAADALYACRNSS